jgi:hypothetical protein
MNSSITEEAIMYIELEAPTRERTTATTIYVGPFADEAAARQAIEAAPNAAWEPQRRVTGNGITLMARAIVATRRHHYPVVPQIPADREAFALLAYQYA